MAHAAQSANIKPAQTVDLGQLTVDHNQTIAAKLAAITNPKCVACRTDWANDERFPDPLAGQETILYAASAWHFGCSMPQDVLKASVEADGKILGTPKPLIELAVGNPRPKLDDTMPLVAAGQFFVDAGGYRRALHFELLGAGRYLDDVWLRSGIQWVDYWWFLVLEELPSEA